MQKWIVKVSFCLCLSILVLFLLESFPNQAFAQEPAIDPQNIPSLEELLMREPVDAKPIAKKNPSSRKQKETGSADQQKAEKRAFASVKKRPQRIRPGEDAAVDGMSDWSDITEPNSLLHLEFQSQVTFVNKEGESYLQIVYETKIESEIVIAENRWRGKGEAQITNEIFGNLVGNELFTCKLDITINAAPVNFMTQMQVIPEKGDRPESYKAALQLKLGKDYKEDWYANCNGADGSVMNSKGDYEKYNQVVLEAIEPNLYGILINEFDPFGPNEIELVTEPIEMNDLDLGETIQLSGSGVLTIEMY